MSKIEHIKAREILDSNGWPTLEVEVVAEKVSGIASVPAGTSTGRYEAKELRDHESDRYQGRGVRKAIKKTEEVIAPALVGKEIANQKDIDELLQELDGTKDKNKLGANTTLAVSAACARAATAEENLPLFKYLSRFFEQEPSIKQLKLFANCINGGRHAGNDLAMQEYLVIPQCGEVREAIELVASFYHGLRETLRQRFGKSATNVGFEGGFAPPIQAWLMPFELFISTTMRTHLGDKFKFGIDAAASEFYGGGLYSLSNGEHLLKEVLLKKYQEVCQQFPIYSIEDPFYEDDFDSFSLLRKQLQNVLIVGDDLTVTNLNRMRQAHEKSSINAVIIKPNQIGTLSETIDAIKKARQYGWQVIVSHRSGETNDDLIVHLAAASRADGIKLGAPARGERIAKYNELLRIAEVMQ